METCTNVRQKTTNSHSQTYTSPLIHIAFRSQAKHHSLEIFTFWCLLSSLNSDTLEKSHIYLYTARDIKEYGDVYLQININLEVLVNLYYKHTNRDSILFRIWCCVP